MWPVHSSTGFWLLQDHSLINRISGIIIFPVVRESRISSPSLRSAFLLILGPVMSWSHTQIQTVASDPVMKTFTSAAWCGDSQTCHPGAGLLEMWNSGNPDSSKGLLSHLNQVQKTFGQVEAHPPSGTHPWTFTSHPWESLRDLFPQRYFYNIYSYLSKQRFSKKKKIPQCSSEWAYFIKESWACRGWTKTLPQNSSDAVGKAMVLPHGLLGLMTTWRLRTWPPPGNIIRNGTVVAKWEYQTH